MKVCVSNVLSHCLPCLDTLAQNHDRHLHSRVDHLRLLVGPRCGLWRCCAECNIQQLQLHGTHPFWPDPNL